MSTVVPSEDEEELETIVAAGSSARQRQPAHSRILAAMSATAQKNLGSIGRMSRC